MKQKDENFLNGENVKITKQPHDFKGYANSYNVEILNYLNPGLQLNRFIVYIKRFQIRDNTILVLEFKKVQSNDKTLYSTFYSNSRTEIIINESDIDDVSKSIYTTTIWNIQKSLGQGSGCIIDSVIDNTIDVSN